MDAAVVTHRQFFAVHKVETRGLGQTPTNLSHQIHQVHATGNKLDKSIVGRGLRKMIAQILQNTALVVVFKTFIPTVMVKNQERHHLAGSQPWPPAPLTSRSRKKESIIRFYKIIRPNEYFKQLLFINFGVHRLNLEKF